MSTSLEVLALALVTPALERGDTCTLKSPLSVSIRQKAGVVEATLDVGTQVEVVGVSDGGSARIRAGDVKGDVASADLQSACSGTLRLCRLSAPVMMYEQNRSDSKSWRIKEGATVNVLKRGKTWAAVRVGDLLGFVKRGEVDGACVAQNGGPLRDEEAISVEEVERGDGPGVLFLPFGLEGATASGAADALLDLLYDRAAIYRPDAARLGVELDAGARDEPWKAQLTAGARRARGAETAYVVVGRLATEVPKPDTPLVERYVLQLGVVEAKTGKLLKAVRIRPTLDVRDNWTDKALAALLPSVAAAPGSKLPVLESGSGFEVAPIHTDDEAPPPQKAEALPPQEPPSALANPWAWAALGSAALLGAGSGVVGALALEENSRANDLTAADPTQARRRNTALAEAVTADALGVAAVSLGVAGVVLFATRAGLE